MNNDRVDQPAVSSPEPRPRSTGRAPWARVKALFLAALDQTEPEQERFLERACEGDAALRNEVAALLASDRAASRFIETPAAALMAMGSPPAAERAQRLEPGTRLGAYEIVGFLSAGGMGEVYRARHTILGRDVAIKTVLAGETEGSARQRLVREARHAATLDHPNICTIHEVGEVGGSPFVVMALVDGHPLRDLIAGTPLPLERALDYGTQVAAALEHAHRHGIIHRDLKSSNVVIDRDGRAVVLDFGLARRLPRLDARTADLSVTVDGSLAGTLSHMAPEVLLGRSADPRSDVWSLGVLLYELLTGHLPFQGQTPFETSSAILGESPAPMSRRLPLGVRLVVERCLKKDPGERYATSAEVRRALESVRRRRGWAATGRLLLRARRRTLVGGMVVAALVAGAVSAGSHVPERLRLSGGSDVSALAFLPFENATDDDELEYYAAGFAGALIERLGTVTDVRLISPAPGAATPAGSGSPAELAGQLGADAVVTGRLRAASGRVAVDVQLMDTRRGRVLWSDTFERAPQHALALQADVVRAIAAEVRLSLRTDSRERLATTRAVNPEAYEAFLKGRFEWNHRTQASLDRAVEHFTRAIELDPTYAPAHAALADCYNQLGTVMVGRGSPSEFRPLAAAAAIRALQIDPNSAEAHAALAYVRHYDWQWEEAEQGFRRAIALNPSFALARSWYANFLMSRQRHDEALAQVYAARELDPFSLVVHTNIAWVLLDAGKPQEALVQLRQTLALDPTYPQARMRLVDALVATGRPTEAVVEAEALAVDTDGWVPAVLALAHARAAAGEIERARALLEEVLDRERAQYIAPWSVAAVYVRLGDIENALAWYERALEERSNAMVYVPVDPEAGPLQRHPRFRELVARAGLI
jgi:eukaryotic-like serine/threonine-protein kinase